MGISWDFVWTYGRYIELVCGIIKQLIAGGAPPCTIREAPLRPRVIATSWGSHNSNFTMVMAMAISYNWLFLWDYTFYKWG